MHLLKIYLKNFRSYTESELSLSPHVNVFYGSNAQGKTNLLEAIYLLSTGKSFRTLHLKELIKEKEGFFHIRAHFFKDGVEQSISLSFDGHNRKLHHNETSYHSFTPLFGILPSVLLAPEDAALINGSPADRRRFFDLHLAQIDPLYVYHLGRYLQALKQRNTLLRQKTEIGIEPWEKTMAISASYISQKRFQLIQKLEPITQEMLQILTDGKEQIKLAYAPSIAINKNYEEAYKANRQREIYIGSSLIGPHRDDLLITISGREARIYASEGQKGTAVAALKLAEWLHLKEFSGEPPLFGIDDFGIHLDEERKKRLQHLLGKLAPQVFLTSPELPDGENMNLFKIAIENGSSAPFHH